MSPTTHGRSHPTRRHPGSRGNQSLGVAVVALGGVFILGDVLSAVSAPFALRSYHRAAEQGIDPTTVATAHDFAVVFVFIGLPMWIVTSLWLARARSNAAALVPTGLHRSAIWCWLGWVVPIVSFWFPKQIVDDSWELTSNRLAAAARPGATGRPRPGGRCGSATASVPICYPGSPRRGRARTAGSTSSPRRSSPGWAWLRWSPGPRSCAGSRPPRRRWWPAPPGGPSPY